MYHNSFLQYVLFRLCEWKMLQILLKMALFIFTKRIRQCDGYMMSSFCYTFWKFLARILITILGNLFLTWQYGAEVLCEPSSIHYYSKFYYIHSWSSIITKCMQIRQDDKLVIALRKSQRNTLKIEVLKFFDSFFF